VRALDGLNPKMSAGMASAFENWRRYDADRQALMRAELEKTLKTEGISPNLFEVVTKILGRHNLSSPAERQRGEGDPAVRH